MRTDPEYQANQREASDCTISECNPGDIVTECCDKRENQYIVDIFILHTKY